jgi:hypothetical protein
MQYVAEYKFELDEKPFYYDLRLGGFSRGTVKQIKIDVSVDTLILTDAIYYVLHLANGGTVQVVESSLFETLSPPTVPPTAEYSIICQYTPGDTAWLAVDATNTVSYVTVAQIEIIKYSNVTSVSYWVNAETNDCHRVATSIKVPAYLLFETSNDAWVYLGVLEAAPTPTPSTTPPIAPTPTPAPTYYPPASGGVNLTLVSAMNDDVTTLFKGTPVYLRPDGSIARANNDITAITFLGFVYDDYIAVNGYGQIIVEGIMNTTISNWNDVILGSDTMDSSVLFYLSGLGTISPIPPTSGYVREVGIGLSTTSFEVRTMPAYGL